jgi:hypothetical protein
MKLLDWTRVQPRHAATFPFASGNQRTNSIVSKNPQSIRKPDYPLSRPQSSEDTRPLALGSTSSEGDYEIGDNAACLSPIVEGTKKQFDLMGHSNNTPRITLRLEEKASQP